MKKLMLCICVCLMVAGTSKVGTATESANWNNEIKLEKYIAGIYSQINFGKNDCLAYNVFDVAYRGYMNLQNAGKLNTDEQILTVCDFTKSSNVKRMWVIDLNNKKVLFNTFVAHGQGSGEEMATAFSNKENSHQSSLGFYITADTYMGEHGLSLRLQGMDYGYNDAAYDRGIVVHGASYVSNNFIGDNDRLGRSWGCPAVPSELSTPIINTIKDGTCLFIYYPEKNYMKTAYWLNKKIDNNPGNDIYSNFAFAHAKRDTVVQYVVNGKIDSSKTKELSLLHQ